MGGGGRGSGSNKNGRHTIQRAAANSSCTSLALALHFCFHNKSSAWLAMATLLSVGLLVWTAVGSVAIRVEIPYVRPGYVNARPARTRLSVAGTQAATGSGCFSSSCDSRSAEARGNTCHTRAYAARAHMCPTTRHFDLKYQVRQSEGVGTAEGFSVHDGLTPGRTRACWKGPKNSGTSCTAAAVVELSAHPLIHTTWHLLCMLLRLQHAGACQALDHGQINRDG